MNTQNVANESSSTASTAVEEARETKDTAVRAGAHLASSAQEEARSVVGEAGSQIHNVASDLMGSLQEQASTQQQKLADGLRSLGTDLKTMADSGNDTEGPTTAQQWVREAGRRASEASDWLDRRDPAALIGEVKRFARRRPLAFLGIAVGAGILAGRLTRGLSAGSSEHELKNEPDRSPRSLDDPQVPPVQVPPTPDYVLAARQAGTAPDYQPLAPPAVAGPGTDEFAGGPSVSRSGFGAGAGAAVGGAAGTLAGTANSPSTPSDTVGRGALDSDTVDYRGEPSSEPLEPSPYLDRMKEADPELGRSVPELEPDIDLESPELEPDFDTTLGDFSQDADPDNPASGRGQRGPGEGGGFA